MAQKRFTDRQAWTLTAVFIACAIALGLWLSGGGNPAERPAAKRPLDISADKLAEAYSENPLSADEKFSGQWLRISGSVAKIGTEILGRPFVMLGGVQCVFGTEYKHTLAEMRVGSEITVIGKCGGRTLGIVILDDCEP